jgi:RNA polymerase sigma-54 factor
MMHMEHRLTQTQSQRLMLTQKMQQAIHILQLSTIELDQYIQQEMETNPVLEQQQKDPEPGPEPNSDNGDSSDSKDQFDDVGFDLDEFAKGWNEPGKEGRDFSVNREADERREHYVNSITREESLSSHLLTQLRLATDDPRRIRIGEHIIGEIDHRGYFGGSLEEIAHECDATVDEVTQVLYRVQRFEPTGVGARDIVECLLLQANVDYPDDDELRTLIEDHLVELEHRQIPQVAKAMKISPERVEELRDKLARLDPWPGLEYSAEPPHYVTPDVIVEKNEETGELEVYLTDETVPELRINSRYREMARKKNLGKDEKQYLRDKVESARWLIRNIEQRQQTILKIASAIVEVQGEFFEKGVEAIKPLTLQEIAEKVGVHEATVSRTTRGKYMQTPQGLFEMKYFFSPGLKTDDGDAQSSKSVQSIIQKIVDEEDKRKPLSDQKIANLLKDQGINIARRTVTKYREALGVPPTTMRKSYQG